MSEREPNMRDAATLQAGGVDVEEAIEELRESQDKLVDMLSKAAKQLRDVAEQGNLVCVEAHSLRQEFKRLTDDMHDTNNKVDAMFKRRDLEFRELKGRFGLC